MLDSCHPSLKCEYINIKNETRVNKGTILIFGLNLFRNYIMNKYLKLTISE